MNKILISAGIDLAKDYFTKQQSKTGSRPIDQPQGKEPIKQIEIVNELLTQGMDNRPFWKRKTFWSMVAGVAVPILNKTLGWQMDITEVTATISPLLLFIATEQWKKK